MRTITFLLLSAALTCRVTGAGIFRRTNSTDYPPASAPANGTRYAIMDNDWIATGFIPFLLVLDAGMEILALASDTCDTWVDQTTLHAVSPADLRGCRKTCADAP